MWSFLVTVGAFLVLVLLASLSQHRARRASREERRQLEQKIHLLAEVAQRRHRARFGREDSGLHETLNPKPKRPHGRHGKAHA